MELAILTKTFKKLPQGGEEFYSKTSPAFSGDMIDMACPMFDAENNMCKQLQKHFPEGAQTPCEFVNDPSKCPIVMMNS